MFKSPRRNGRNKGLKIKHAIQISLLLGVSVWLLYQIHHSDDKKLSVTTEEVSHKSNNDSNADISKLGRKVLRPKVKETKEQKRADDEQNNENEGSEDVEDHESDEHEDGKEDGEEIKEHEKGNNEEIKGKLNGNTRNEQSRAVVMENTEKDVSPSEDNDGGGDDHNEHNFKDQTAREIDIAPTSYSYETNAAKYVKPSGNEKNMKGSYAEAQSKKDDVAILEEEKDAFTVLETLPENVTGGSISLKNAATE